MKPRNSKQSCVWEAKSQLITSGIAYRHCGVQLYPSAGMGLRKVLSPPFPILTQQPKGGRDVGMDRSRRNPSASAQVCQPAEWPQVKATVADSSNIPVLSFFFFNIFNLFLHISCLTTASYLNFSSPSLSPFPFNFLCVTHPDLPPSDFDSSLPQMCWKQRTKRGHRSAHGNYSHLHSRCLIRWHSHVHLLPPACLQPDPNFPLPIGATSSARQWEAIPTP